MAIIKLWEIINILQKYTDVTFVFFFLSHKRNLLKFEFSEGEQKKKSRNWYLEEKRKENSVHSRYIFDIKINEIYLQVFQYIGFLKI